MKALLNKKIIEIDSLSLSSNNRGFRYGDGLFETIAVINGKPRLLERHIKRLAEGADILKLEIIDQLTTEKIDTSILQLQNANNLFGDAIVKLMIWRNAKGRYLPDDDKSAILLTIDEAEINKVISIPKAGF